MPDPHDPIKTIVQEFLLQEFLPGEDPDNLTNDTPLISGAILDSINTLKLVNFLEERFDVTIDAHEADIDHLDTIDRIARLIASKQAAA